MDQLIQYEKICNLGIISIAAKIKDEDIWANGETGANGRVGWKTDQR